MLKCNWNLFKKSSSSSEEAVLLSTTSFFPAFLKSVVSSAVRGFSVSSLAVSLDAGGLEVGGFLTEP